MFTGLKMSLERAIRVGSLFAGLATLSFSGCAQLPRKELPVPARIMGSPGSVLVKERMPGAPWGSTAWRILYVSKGMRGDPIPVSGVVIVPGKPLPEGSWDVIVWAHPTTGVKDSCAPSLNPNFFHRVPGLKDMLDRGFVVATTDYPGLGTPGVHPYLVGESEGRAVLDAAKAAGKVVRTSRRFAVWGHSQGGQAVLFAGQMARKYASDMQLVSVAAAAPATDLKTLLVSDISSPVGKVLGCYALWSWCQVYGIPQSLIFDPRDNDLLNDITSTCVENLEEGIRIARFARRLQPGFLEKNPATTEPWKSLLLRNTPGNSPIKAPIFISQGTADPIVHYSVTTAFVERLRGQGEEVTFLALKGVKHNPAGKVTAPFATAWLAEQFSKRQKADSLPLR